MSPIKDKMTEIIHSQLGDSSYDEIARELIFKQMIERGLDDSISGRVISDEEMKERILSWQR